MVHPLKTFLESGIVVPSISAVWEDTDGCAQKYMHALAIYLMTVLSSSYGIIMDRAINAPGHGKNVVDGINATNKRYLKGLIELMGKLASNDTKNIGMIPSASKDVSINFVDQCLHILKNKEILNGLKSSTKIQKIQSRLKYQPRTYNVQRNSDVDNRGMKMKWNNKLFSSLNIINGKTFPYSSKGILRHYHYWSDPKLGLIIFSIRMIPCSFHACTAILSLFWDYKIKE